MHEDRNTPRQKEGGGKGATSSPAPPSTPCRAGLMHLSCRGTTPRPGKVCWEVQGCFSTLPDCMQTPALLGGHSHSLQEPRVKRNSLLCQDALVHVLMQGHGQLCNSSQLIPCKNLKPKLW